ncbi:hypothetical protein BDQ12DRAFT_673980 [Crucibulum laeve]|uniref:Uncharacterized protein n=1 Tax=Crucibulum laeve TaxID=68775 RepID=A0A5C3MI14_9AGAR|nr:hypothetical protein BDQ12DRAFT_673980 [Crucibulum laeve]
MSAASATTFVPVDPNNPVIQVLDRHNTGHGAFISHLDKHKKMTKFIVFLPVLAINTALATLLIYRFLSGSSVDLIVGIFLGKYIAPSYSTSKSLKSWIWVTLCGLFDYYLFKNAMPPVYRFITTHLWVRLRYGFRDTEVVFRAPTGWRKYVVDNLPPEQARWEREKALGRAIAPKLLAENPGYTTRSDFWVLHYPPTMDAYWMEKNGNLPLDAWDLRVWQKDPQHGWMVLEAYKLNEHGLSEAILEVVKEMLRAQGKEELITRWLEMAAKGEDWDRMLKSEGVNIQTLWAEALTIADARRKAATEVNVNGGEEVGGNVTAHETIGNSRHIIPPEPTVAVPLPPAASDA